MAEYRRPFVSPDDREPIYRFPNEVPIAGTPSDVYAMAVAYHEWLLETETPKDLPRWIVFTATEQCRKPMNHKPHPCRKPDSDMLKPLYGVL
jgi:hypothetical protein